MRADIQFADEVGELCNKQMVDRFQRVVPAGQSVRCRPFGEPPEPVLVAPIYQKPASQRRRPHLGTGLAARLAWSPTSLRLPPRRLETGTTKAQRHLFNKFLGQLHHCLHTNQPLQRTPGISPVTRPRGLTLN